MFIVFFISAIAETNRPPFDLPEAESELVAGHMVEYSSTPFLLFFLGEFVAICLMCAYDDYSVPGWLVATGRLCTVQLGSRCVWFVLKACSSSSAWPWSVDRAALSL